MKNFKPINPNSKFSIVFNIVNAFYIAYFCLSIPLEICFDTDISSFNYIFESLGKLFLIMEILVNFNMGFFKRGKYYEQRELIILKYLKNEFIIDFLSILILSFFQAKSHFRFLYLIKYFSYSKKISKIESHFYLKEKYQNIYSIIKLMLRTMIFNHLFACMWYL